MKDWLFAVVSACIAFFNPAAGLLLTVGALVFADAITGMIAAKKRGENVNSAGMRRTVSKMFIFQTVVLTGWMLEQHVLESLLPVARIAAAAICIVEFKSLLENVTEITGVSFASILKKLGSDNDK